MSEEQQPQYREGDIISAKVDEQGVIQVETIRDGEVHGQSFGREGFTTQDGVHHDPGPAGPLSMELPNGEVAEGRVLDARVNEQGDIELTRYEAGEVRLVTVAEEPMLHSDPVPTEVPLSAASELDAAVHQMAVEAQPAQAAPVVEVEAPLPTVVIEQNGPVTIMEVDQYGELRGHTYDVEPVRRDVEEPRVVIHDTEQVMQDGHVYHAEPADDAHDDSMANVHHDGGETGSSVSSPDHEANPVHAPQDASETTGE